MVNLFLTVHQLHFKQYAQYGGNRAWSSQFGSLAVPQKVKESQKSIPSYTQILHTSLCKNLYTNVHSNIFRNRQNCKQSRCKSAYKWINQMSTQRNIIGNKKEQCTDTCNKMDEP